MLPKFISAFEHQQLPVGVGRGSAAITPQEGARLARLSESRPGFCTLGHQSVRLAQYAGLVGMGDRVLEILPKVEPEDGVPEVGRGIFLRLLRLSTGLKVFTTKVSTKTFGANRCWTFSSPPTSTRFRRWFVEGCYDGIRPQKMI